MKKIGVVFPGQGSQSQGMLAELAAEFSLVSSLFQEASEVLHYSLWELVQNGPAEKLDQTEFTQPALLVADVAVYRCWRERGGAAPIVMAGHSLGEYSALVCAESLDFQTAVKLVAARGRYMQEAVKAGEGAMAAIVGLPDETVITLCEEVAQGEVVSAANFNSIGQVVVAGHAAAVDRLVELAKTAGAKIAKRIPVSVPSHCALMATAAEKLAQELKSVHFHTPKIPVIQNASVQIEHQAEKIREALIRQLVAPVRWVETIQHMKIQGVEVLIECGPGKVLSGLNKRIEKEIPNYNVDTPESLSKAIQEVK